MQKKTANKKCLVFKKKKVKQLIKSLLNTNEDKKWPGLEIWNFANCFAEDVKKNHIFPQTEHPRFRKKSTSEFLESTISSKRLPVSTFKDVIHQSPNDYYLVTDSEGNIGNMRFLPPIPEPQVTKRNSCKKIRMTLQGTKSYIVEN